MTDQALKIWVMVAENISFAVKLDLFLLQMISINKTYFKC